MNGDGYIQKDILYTCTRHESHACRHHRYLWVVWLCSSRVENHGRFLISVERYSPQTGSGWKQKRISQTNGLSSCRSCLSRRVHILHEYTYVCPWNLYLSKVDISPIESIFKWGRYPRRRCLVRGLEVSPQF